MRVGLYNSSTSIACMLLAAPFAVASTMSSTPRTPRGRIIRRQETLWESIKSYPADVILNLSADIESFDWEQAGAKVSIPIALIINAVFVFAELTLLYSSRQPILQGSKGKPTAEWKYTSRVDVAWFLAYSLMAFSFVNAFYLFTKTKTYQLLENDLDEPISSNNARVVEFDSSTPSHNIYSRLKLSLYYSFWGKKRTPNTRMIRELVPWDPPRFHLDLFCLFSPIQVMLLHNVTRENVSYVLLFAICLSAQTFYLARSFLGLIQDRRIIDTEVLREYNVKFVNPRLFMEKRDVGVGTEAAIDEGYGWNTWSPATSPPPILNRTPLGSTRGTPLGSNRGTPSRADETLTWVYYLDMIILADFFRHLEAKVNRRRTLASTLADEETNKRSKSPMSTGSLGRKSRKHA